MLSTNFLKIADNGKSLSLNMEVAVGGTIKRIHIWKGSEYKILDEVLVIDDTILVNIDNTEIVTVQASSLGIEKFGGSFFVEVLYIEPGIVEELKTTYVIGNFIPYYECVLNAILKAKFNNCKQVENNCIDCDVNIPYVNALIDILLLSSRVGAYKEIIKISKLIEDNCLICTTCDNNDSLIIPGTSLGIINNKAVIL